LVLHVKPNDGELIMKNNTEKISKGKRQNFDVIS